MQLRKQFDFLKADTKLGLVFGWGMICKVNGQDYYDAHGDHFTEEGMLKAVSEFSNGDRIAKDMHSGESIGVVQFTFPLTTEIAKTYDITVNKSGWLVAVKPNDDGIVEKFLSGDRTGFSIGGFINAGGVSSA